MCKLRSALFRRLQLEKPRVFPYCLEFAERAKRRLLRPRRPLSKFLNFHRLEIHIHKQAREPFGSFPFEPIACITAGYAGSSSPTASAHFRRRQLQLCVHPGPILSCPRSAYFCIHQIKPFHKTQLCSIRSLGRLSPSRETLFNERKLILDQIAAEAVTSLHCGRRWFSSHLRIRAFPYSFGS